MKEKMEEQLRLRVNFDKNADREVCILFIRRKIEEERLACMKDVCMYCSGRAPQWEREVSGKSNSAGNYVHISKEGDSITLCAASSIVARANWLKENANSDGDMFTD